MNVPSLQDLITSILSDLNAKLGITGSIGKKVLYPIAFVQAAKIRLIYIYGARIYQNIFVDLAEPESLGGTLERFGRVKLSRDRFPAVAGVYDIEVTGSNGVVIPSGTTYKSLDTSTSPDKIYRLDTEFIFTSTTGIIQVRALEAGSDSRLEVGDQMQITSPLPNVDSYADVITVIESATEQESISDYRNEVIRAFQVETQGGARTDYREWASDAAGVLRTFPYARDGFAGEINLYVESPVADSVDGKGTPPQSILDNVAEVVEYDPDTTKPDNARGRRPLGTFEIHTLAINPLDVDVEITGLTDNSFLSSINDAINAYLLNIRPYIAGADNVLKANQGRLYLAEIQRQIIEVLGSDATFTNATMKVSGVTQTLYIFIEGNIPYLNSVTSV